VGKACLGYDPEEANRLLDGLGLKRRGAGGPRLLPDGRPMRLVVETAGEGSEQGDALELVRDQWAELGIEVDAKPSDREVLRERVFSGDALMTVFFGLDNGVPVPEQPPSAYAPTSQADQMQWPKWGQWYETRGAAGEAPDVPEAKRLLELYGQWQRATTVEAQASAWREMLKVYAGQCYTIGLVAGVQQPIAVRKSLHNVPEKAIFNWEPQAQLGVYLPDTFWYGP
jgi:peptide/nickel transport system substrate-binding protein